MKKQARLLIAAFMLIAIIYNSWPLGYLLDKYTAKYGLASDLETPGHPYAWLFVAGDVLCAILLILVSAYLYSNKKKLKSKVKTIYWSGICLGLTMFGFFTGFGASAPDTCPKFGVSVCVNIDGRLLSVDVIETTLAALGMLIAMCCTALIALNLKNKWLKLTNSIVFMLWAISGLWLSYDLYQQSNMHTSQQYYLSSCGLGLVFMGIVYAYSIKGLIHQRSLQHTAAQNTSS